MKNVALLTKDGAFALFFRPHPGEFDSSSQESPPPKKNANAQVELTDALRITTILTKIHNRTTYTILEGLNGVNR